MEWCGALNLLCVCMCVCATETTGDCVCVYLCVCVCVDSHYLKCPLRLCFWLSVHESLLGVCWVCLSMSGLPNVGTTCVLCLGLFWVCVEDVL